MMKRISNKAALLLMLAVGFVTVAATALVGMYLGRRDAQRTMDRTVYYLERQCVTYREIIVADEVKSLVRLTEQAAELATSGVLLPGIWTDEYLEDYARRQRMTDVLVLDGELKPEFAYGEGEWHDLYTGSAIAAIAPVIEATDMDIAYGMSATFLFDTIMIVVFPILGRAMGLSDAAFGLWAGTAVNDTSSVVATGFAFSEAAGDFATMVKLTRTLAIIPTVLVFSAISMHLKKKEAAARNNSAKVNMKSVFPWFILGFLAMSLLCSIGLIPASAASILKTISKFLMVAALAAIGLNTDFSKLCKSGARPMLHGFVISLLVVLVAIGVEYALGIAPSGVLG